MEFIAFSVFLALSLIVGCLIIGIGGMLFLVVGNVIVGGIEKIYRAIKRKLYKKNLGKTSGSGII